MEERTDGILLRPRRGAGPKLSWEDTAAEMAAQSEDWSDWDGTLADGIHELSWEPANAKHVAEPSGSYPARAKRAPKT